MPLSQRLIDAENAHKLAIWAGRHNILFSKRIKVEDEQILVSSAYFLFFEIVLPNEPDQPDPSQPEFGPWGPNPTRNRLQSTL